jgi:RNA polymerase sigma-70 factor (ECF subfamily)
MEQINTTSFWNKAYQFALSVAKTRLDRNDQFWVEDVAQNAVIKAFQSFNQFDQQKGSFNTWLNTITRNLCFDFSKRKEKEMFRIGEDINIADRKEEEQDEIYQKEAQIIQMEQAMRMLSHQDKTMLWMKYYENASSRMISNKLEVQEACVPMYVKRARKKLEMKMHQISA